MIKMGIIGLGHMGGYHASICTTLPQVSLIGIADLSTDNWKKVTDTNVIKTKDYHDWIDKVEAVIIAVPTQFHYKIAKDCLSRHKHVLIEKPLTKTLTQALDLFSIARDNNCCLHVGHVERFNAAVQQLKKIVHDPYLIQSHRMGPFTPRPQKDSVILDLMIHDLDIILNLVDSQVACIQAVGHKVKTDQADIATVQLKFENGVLATIVASRTSQIKKRAMSIHQHGAFIHLDFTTQDISIHTRTTDSFKIGDNQMQYKQKGTVQRLFVYKDNPLKLEIENFVHSCLTRTNLIDAEQDIGALKIAFEIEKAIEELL